MKLSSSRVEVSCRLVAHLLLGVGLLLAAGTLAAPDPLRLLFVLGALPLGLGSLRAAYRDRRELLLASPRLEADPGGLRYRRYGTDRRARLAWDQIEDLRYRADARVLRLGLVGGAVHELDVSALDDEISELMPELLAQQLQQH